MINPRRASVGLLAVFALVLSLVSCASGPTSSPENAARAFLDAMKSNSLETALSVYDPTTSPLADEAEGIVPLSDMEQATSAPTGVTDFEIINQVVSESGVATITASLTGGSVSQMTVKVRQGGPSGDDWLVYGVEPGFAFVEVSEWMTSEWSLQLAGGTPAPEGTKRILMLPGSSLDGATLADANGYFEPVTLLQREGRLVADLFLVTDAGGAAAHAHHMKFAGQLTAEMLANARELTDYFRVISEPAFEIGAYEKESDTPRIRSEITWISGEFERCIGSRTGYLPWSPLEYTMRSFGFFGSLNDYEIVAGSGKTFKTTASFDPSKDEPTVSSYNAANLDLRDVRWIDPNTPKLSDCE